MRVLSRLLSMARLFASHDDEIAGCLVALTAMKANEGESWLQDTLDARDTFVNYILRKRIRHCRNHGCP